MGRVYMSSKLYTLDGHIAVVCHDIHEWGKWFGTADRHVADIDILGIRVSTVFLGLDHNHWGDGDPLLFETMVFDHEGDCAAMTRYFTWEEAAQGHAEVVEGVQAEADKCATMAADEIRDYLLEHKVKP